MLAATQGLLLPCAGLCQEFNPSHSDKTLRAWEGVRAESIDSLLKLGRIGHTSDATWQAVSAPAGRRRAHAYRKALPGDATVGLGRSYFQKYDGSRDFECRRERAE